MRNRVSRREFLQAAAAGAIVGGLDSHLRPATAQAQAKPTAADWSMKATIIEACSCTMFCPCYFSTVPSAHGMGSSDHSMAEHYCRFNMGYRVNQGRFGTTSLDGAKFWIAGDLGADFSKGADWAEITFDPKVTKAQRDAITTIIPNVYPVTWNAFSIGQDAPVEWSATKDRAEARLDGGKAGIVVLRRNPGMTEEPVVIRNLRYFGAPRNTGFVLMPNEIEAYRVGPKAFEYKGTNGFMITYDITSKDIKAKA
jgi:hypothetical protein